MREVRQRCGLSLRQLEPFVGLTHAGIGLIERGEMWETATVERVARVLDERCPQAGAA